MAKFQIVILLIIYVIFTEKSIIKIHVNSEIQHHHIRHLNHHLHNKRLLAAAEIAAAAVATSVTADNMNITAISIGHPSGSNPNGPVAIAIESEIDEHSEDSAVESPPPLEVQRASQAFYRQRHQRNVTGQIVAKMAAATMATVIKQPPIDIVKEANIKCPKCSGNANVQISEEQLIELRIEFVKNQILQKLRLKQRPQITVGDLPRPIYEGTTLHVADVQSHSKDLDDYYARTSQKFIFLEQERVNCERITSNPTLCFRFEIVGDIDSIDVSTAELWLYKNANKDDLDHRQTFVVSELEFNDSINNNNGEQRNDSRFVPKTKPIAIQSIEREAGWVKIDIAWITKQWFTNRQTKHYISISCQFCELDDIENANELDTDDSTIEKKALLSTERDHRPFILIDTLNRRKLRRPKRNVNCSVGVTECCREKLFISFAEIGWDDWILQPSGYDAYFCRGSCTTVASITMSNSHYSSVLRKIFYQRTERGDKPLELIPCCTAKKFSSLQLLYLDSNNTGTVKTLPNMVVESCGCM